MFYIRVEEGKNEINWKKEGNLRISIFVPNFRNVTQVVAEKSLTEKMSICII